jgi:hypothetical protein
MDVAKETKWLTINKWNKPQWAGPSVFLVIFNKLLVYAKKMQNFQGMVLLHVGSYLRASEGTLSRWS